MKPEDKFLKRGAQLSEDELDGVTGGVTGPSRTQPPASPQPSIPSIPTDPYLAANPTPTPTPTPSPTPAPGTRRK